MLPDIVSDSVTDCAKKIGTQFVEKVFFEASKDAQFPNPADRAQALYRVWMRDGYRALPQWTKDFILRVMDGNYIGNPSERI